MMRRLLNDERGSVYPYLVFWVIIIFSALIWILFNEVILHVADWVSTTGTADGGTWVILMTLYRLTPVVILLSALTWAIVQSHRGTEVVA